MNIIPANVRRAAARGFIRTGAQSLASAIPAGGVALHFTGDALLSAGIAAGSAVITAVLAGGASALSIIANGIPEDYQAPSLSGHLDADLVEDVEEEDPTGETIEEEPPLRGRYAE